MARLRGFARFGPRSCILALAWVSAIAGALLWRYYVANLPPNWPSGMQVLNVLCLMMGSEILPHLIVTAMTVLTALGLASLARRWLDRDTAWLAATLYLTVPMVRFLSDVALVDGALGFFGWKVSRLSNSQTTICHWMPRCC
jgi:hypothetical protein